MIKIFKAMINFAKNDELLTIIIIPFISQDQAKINEEYKKLELTHTKFKNEEEVLEKEIEYKTAWKNKLTCVIKAYK